MTQLIRAPKVKVTHGDLKAEAYVYESAVPHLENVGWKADKASVTEAHKEVAAAVKEAKA